MRDATLPAYAGIGSNDMDALARAERVEKEGRAARRAQPPQPSGAIKSPALGKGDGWRKGVGPKFPQGA
jgi:hypothetical protein